MSKRDQVLHALPDAVGVVDADIGVAAVFGERVDIHDADAAPRELEVERAGEVLLDPEEEDAQIVGSGQEGAHQVGAVGSSACVVDARGDALRAAACEHVLQDAHEENRIAAGHDDVNFLRRGIPLSHKRAAGDLAHEQPLVREIREGAACGALGHAELLDDERLGVELFAVLAGLEDDAAKIFSNPRVQGHAPRIRFVHPVESRGREGRQSGMIFAGVVVLHGESPSVP